MGNILYNFLLELMMKCATNYSVVTVIKKSYVDPSVDHAIKDFVFNADLSLHLKSNVQLATVCLLTHFLISTIFAIFVDCLLF